MRQTFLALFVSLLIVWGVSIFLGSHPNWRVNDPETGFQLPAPGSFVARFTEGGAVSHYGRLGLNPIVYSERNKTKPFFLLHGDSYIEALQVSDEDKPDAVLTSELSERAVCYGTGRSGYGFPSMLGRAMEYERVLGRPVAHIFFCASGIRNDVFEDGGGEIEKIGSGYKKKIVGMSSAHTLYSKIVNRLHINFLVEAHKAIADVLSEYRKPKMSAQSKTEAKDDLERELEFIFKAMNSQLKAPAVIVYCPVVPRISHGCVVRENVESDDAAVLIRCAEGNGLKFVDLTGVLLDLYDEKRIVARGFPNLGGPGNGHLNVEGIKTVFQYVAKYLKEAYDF